MAGQDSVEVHTPRPPPPPPPFKSNMPISSHLDQTSLVNKGFIVWKKSTAGNPERVLTSTILPIWVANHTVADGDSQEFQEVSRPVSWDKDYLTGS